jgi:uncharacterized protein YdaU (DUF1376 family)
MKPSPEIPLNIGDYLSDTMSLTRAEHGSYILLIMAYWKNGGPIRNDDLILAEIAKCHGDEWPRTKAALSSFFDTSNGTWRHKWIERELLADRMRAQAIAKASAAGVQARRESGQLPPKPSEVPSVQSAVQPSVSTGIRLEKELERVESRIEAIRSGAKQVAMGVVFTPAEKAELARLRARKSELMTRLGFQA